MTQVFDAVESAKAREKAIRQVAESADPEWMRVALEAVRYIAERREEFTTDAVWYRLEQMGAKVPHEPRALGPLMRVSVTMGLADPTDRTVKSIRKACHRRPLRVWRSRLCR